METSTELDPRCPWDMSCLQTLPCVRPEPHGLWCPRHMEPKEEERLSREQWGVWEGDSPSSTRQPSSSLVITGTERWGW